jgi:hypothetical protein
VFDGYVQNSLNKSAGPPRVLGNGNNKSHLIPAMSSSLKETGINVKQATSDADAMILSVSLELADSVDTIVLVGTDTDVLVMLVARAPSDTKLFMFRSSMHNKLANVFSINTTQQAIGEKQKHNLLFLQAVTCDTTSALYRQGKKRVFLLPMSNDDQK